MIPEFLSESREHVEALEKGLLTLERAGTPEARANTVNTLFRSAHTIKGSARLMGYGGLHEVSHALEDVLGALREGSIASSPALVDDLLRAVDRVRILLDQPGGTMEGVAAAVADLRRLAPVEGESEEEPPPFTVTSSPEAAVSAADGAAAAVGASDGGVVAVGMAAVAGEDQAAGGSDTVRVSVSRLDELLRLTGELVMAVQQAQELERRATAVGVSARGTLRDVISGRSGSAGGTWKGAELSTSDKEHAATVLLDELRDWRGDHGDSVRALGSATERIEQEVMALRLYPIATLFAGLPRLVRDLARASGKQVDMRLEGESTELDRRILQGLGEPLMHLLRNAVDHGLETPAARQAAGKPPAGRIAVRAYRRGGQVRIEVGDDGRGMVPQVLRDAAVRKRLLTAEEAVALDDASALELIFLPGFSTTALITETSGRGVGMDVVKNSIGRLGGSVELWTETGKGTLFTLVLPLTLTLARVLFVEINDRPYAVPIGAVEAIVKVSADKVQPGAGREQLVVDGTALPLYSMGQLLGGSLEPVGAPALLLVSSGQRVAFSVGRVVDEREIVLKSLGDVLGRAEIASGATLLPSGGVALVLDAGACIRQARGFGRRGARTEAEKHERRILVVDDSTTTRELERSILVASGYEVDTAADGAEAWRKLKNESYDLVVTDVEMPVMNGFDLTSNIRSDEQLGGLPVIIITTLDKESEKRRGLEVGAQAYLVKNAFDQSALLETIERLLP